MTQPAAITNMPESDSWPDISRVEAWAGEMRVNVIRLIAIVLFYGRHLIEVMLAPADAPVRGAYHLRVTWICLLWAAVAVIVHASLTRRRMPDWLKYATCAWDLILLSLICSLNNGPKSPLVVLYFVVLATAPLRMSLRFVQAATAGAMAAYLVLLGHYAWVVVGFKKYYANAELRIPRSQEAIMLLSLLVAGLLAGQCVRQMRRIASGCLVRLTEGAARDAGTGVRE